jgi:hypothetical protein
VTPVKPVLRTGYREDWEGQIDAFAFLRGNVADDQTKNALDRENGQVPPPLRGDYVTTMHLREDEAQIMVAVLMEAERRMQDLQDQTAVLMKYREHPSGDLTPAEFEAKKALVQELYFKIQQETVDNLRQQLGPDSFSKLDAYVKAWAPRRKVFIQPPPPSRQNVDEKSSAESQPEQ